MYFEGGITVELQKGLKEGEGEKAFLPLFLSSFFLCLFDLVLRGEEEKKFTFLLLCFISISFYVDLIMKGHASN